MLKLVPCQLLCGKSLKHRMDDIGFGFTLFLHDQKKLMRSGDWATCKKDKSTIRSCYCNNVEGSLTAKMDCTSCVRVSCFSYPCLQIQRLMFCGLDLKTRVGDVDKVVVDKVVVFVHSLRTVWCW
jgi:hypothetical protein